MPDLEKYQSPAPLPDEHMRLVGIVAAHWEWVDLILERSVAEMMEHAYSRVALLTTNVSFYAKCDLVMVYARVFKDTEPATWGEFVDALNTLKEAYRTRNEYVHARWRRDRSTGQWGKRVVRTKGGKLTIADTVVTIEELACAAQAIHDAGEKYGQLVQRYGILLPSPEKSDEPHLSPSHDPDGN